MIWYQMVAYQMCERPEKLPEGTEELWDIFARSGIGTDTAEGLAEFLFSEDFLRLASIVNDEHGVTVLAFKIGLLKESEVDGEKVWEYLTEIRNERTSHREPLQLMWSLDESGSEGAYMLAYPDSEISSVEDMEILTDEEDAVAALGAWGEGIPYTLCPTFTYKPDESTGKFVRDSDFSEDMS